MSDVIVPDRSRKCLEWLGASRIDHVQPSKKPHLGTVIDIYTSAGAGKVDVMVSKSTVPGSDKFIAKTFSKTVPECNLAGFDIVARNVPGAARKLVEFAGIDDPDAKLK